MRSAPLAALLISCCSTAYAQTTAFSSFGLGKDYEANGAGGYLGWGVGNDDDVQLGISPFAEAFSFVSESSGPVSAISVAMMVDGCVPQGGAPFELALYSDGGGSVSSLLGSWASSTSISVGTDNEPVNLSTGFGGISLTTGATYWLAAFGDDVNHLKWAFGDYTGPNTRAYAVDASNSLVDSGDNLGLNEAAFSVQMSAVPEPPMNLAFGCATAALLIRRRRRLRSQLRWTESAAGRPPRPPKPIEPSWNVFSHASRY